MNSAIATIDARLASFCVAMEAMGWRVLAVELDLTRERARIEVRRFDGLTITLDAQHGRASLTREVMETQTVKTGRRGDVSRVERVAPRFVGRSRACGARQGLRMFAEYVAANALLALNAGDVRDVLRPLMDGGSYRLNGGHP